MHTKNFFSFSNNSKHVTFIKVKISHEKYFADLILSLFSEEILNNLRRKRELEESNKEGSFDPKS